MPRRPIAIICITSLVFGITIAAWRIWSIFRVDEISFATRSTGNANDGTSNEWFMQSNRGSLTFYTHWEQWHLVSNPNPFPGNEGPAWYSQPAGEKPAVPNSNWHLINAQGTTYAVRGFEALGFGAGRFASAWTGGPEWQKRSQSVARVPHWFVAMLLIVPPVLVLRRLRRLRKRLAAGLCPACGYDLRASKDRCPECGRAIGQEEAK